MKRNKRRLFPIVDKEKQYTFLVIIIIYIIIIAGSLSISLFLPDFMLLTDDKLGQNIRGEIADKIIILHSRVWPGIFAIVCIIAAHWFHIFHRIVGPLYRFRQTYEQIGKGNLELKVNLRHKDYLHKEKDDLNRMIEELSIKMRAIQKAGVDVMLTAEGLENEMANKQDINDSLKKDLRLHREQCDTLMKYINQFKF